MSQSKLILPVIVISQFFCTSLWFAGNAVITELALNFNLLPSALGHLTSAVQIGFIIGAFSFAIMAISDRISPSKVFFVCSVLGALFNFGIVYEGNSYESLLLLRFLTGFFLAGIYPVGMKIAADYFEKGLGKSLGFLVGALVLGTAFPHLLRNMTETISWKSVIVFTSLLALIGGLLMFFLVADGPFRSIGKKINISAFYKVFENSEFRSSAFGYFGHMWELYAFWTFIPVILKFFLLRNPQSDFNISLWSFIIIAVGSFACVFAGILSQKYGVKKIAFLFLLLSFICCLVSPFLFSLENEFVFLSFLVFWGIVVIADSPLFSTLVAKNAPKEIKGTALTIVNGVGFLITIISIQLITSIQLVTESSAIYIVLALGPLFGLMSLLKSRKTVH